METRLYMLVPAMLLSVAVVAAQADTMYGRAGEGAGSIGAIQAGDRIYEVRLNYTDGLVRAINVTDHRMVPPGSTLFDALKDGSGYAGAANRITYSDNRTYVVVAVPGGNAVQILDVTHYDYPGIVHDYNAADSPILISQVTDGDRGAELAGAQDALSIVKWDRAYALVTGSGDYLAALDLGYVLRPHPDTIAHGQERGPDGYSAATLEYAPRTQSPTTAFAIVVGPGHYLRVEDIGYAFVPRPAAVAYDGTEGFEALGGAGAMVPLTIPASAGGDWAEAAQRGPTHVLVASGDDGAIQVVAIKSPDAQPVNATHDAINLPPRADAPQIVLEPVAAIFDGIGGFEALGGVGDMRLAHVGNRTYAVAAGLSDGGIQIIDVTVPSAPEPVAAIFDGIGGFEALGGVTDINILYRADGVYVAALSGGGDRMQIVDISDPYEPAPVLGLFRPAEYGGLGGARHVTLAEIRDRTYAVAAGAEDGAIQIIDVTEPASPVPAATLVDGAGGFEALGGARSFVAVTINGHTYGMAAGHDDDAIQVIDMDMPYAPRPVLAMVDGVGGFEALGGAAGMDTIKADGGTFLVVAGSDDDAVQIVNITDPLRPEPVSAVFDGEGGFDALRGAGHVRCHTTYCAVSAAGDGAVQIIDMSEPASPAPLAAAFDGRDGFKALKSAEGLDIVSLSGHVYAFVAAKGDNAIQIMDITEPSSPVPVYNLFDYTDGFKDINGVRNMDIVAISGKTYAVAVTGIDGAVTILDVSEPAEPKVVSAIHDGRSGFDDLYGVIGVKTARMADRTYAFLASWHDDAVQMLDITEPASPRWVWTMADR